MKRHAILLIALTLVGCSPKFTVHSDRDPDYDLSAYQTFDWKEKVNIESKENPLRYNELNDKRIKTAVLKQMQSRGYSLSEQHSDLLIHYHIVVDDASVLAPEPYGYMYGPFWMRMGIQVYHYRKGTLIIDLVDRNTNNLIWRGWAIADVTDIKPRQVDKIIKLAVEKIFRKFPGRTRGTTMSHGNGIMNPFANGCERNLNSSPVLS